MNLNNTWHGIGRLTSNPEIRQTQNGVSVTTFTIAVNRRYVKGRDRETDFIPCVAWRNAAEFICQYFIKGDPINIEGELQQRKYTDKDGNNRTIYEIIVGEVSFVEGASKKTDNIGNQSHNTTPANNSFSGGFDDVDGDLLF